MSPGTPAQPRKTSSLGEEMPLTQAIQRAPAPEPIQWTFAVGPCAATPAEIKATLSIAKTNSLAIPTPQISNVMLPGRRMTISLYESFRRDYPEISVFTRQSTCAERHRSDAR